MSTTEDTEHLTKLVDVQTISLMASIQIRAANNPGAVEEYAESMRRGDEFPPVDLFDDGETLYVGDGFHRIAASVLAGAEQIPANIHQGGMMEAMAFGFRQNRQHGIRRTNEDKRHAIKLAVEHFPDWSNRSIAQNCGVSHSLVGDVRVEAVEQKKGRKAAGTEVHPEEMAPKRKGLDGKKYPASVERDHSKAYDSTPAPDIARHVIDWTEELKNAKERKGGVVTIPDKLALDFSSLSVGKLCELVRDKRPVSVVHGGYLVRVEKIKEAKKK